MTNPEYYKNKQFPKEIDKLVEFLKIIGEENRLKILYILKNGDRCVCDIWQDIDIPQNLASHHLKVLRDAKLILSHKEGLKVIYQLNKEQLIKFNLLLNNLFKYGEK